MAEPGIAVPIGSAKAVAETDCPIQLSRCNLWTSVHLHSGAATQEPQIFGYHRAMPLNNRAAQFHDTPREYRWESLDDTRLKALKLSGLRLHLRDSLVWPEVKRLYAELDRRGLRFRPHCWLSSEWFSPDGVPGIAIPFFVAHPRLRQLERHMIGDVEGGNGKWRLRILRHEAGHAIDTAYGLRRRADWREVFGYASEPYPTTYTVRPASRRYVLHLGDWYAQSHPTEDFAETFAVWLQPKARWRREYAGWAALKKLEYVDALMAEIADRAPRVRSRTTVAPLTDLRQTLAEHYRRKSHACTSSDRRYDDWLMRVFARRQGREKHSSARRIIREIAPKLLLSLVSNDAINAYFAHHVVRRISERSRELDLVLRTSRRESLRRVQTLHERVAIDMLRRNRETYFL